MDIADIIRTRRTVELFQPKVPPRDVILRAEYDKSERQVRDFSMPFGA